MKYVLAFLICISALSISAQIASLNRAFELNESGESKEAIHIMKSLEKKYSSFSKVEKINYQIIYSKIYIRNQNNSKALHHLIKLKDFIEKNSEKLPENLKNSYYSVFGDFFQSIGAYSIAIEYKKKDYQFTQNKIGRLFDISTIGSMYYQLNENDSALYYFNVQRKISIEIKDTILIASSINNIGLVLLKKNQFREALEKYFTAKNLIKDLNKNMDFYISIKENIGRCYANINENDKAIENLQAVHKYDLQTKKYLKNCFYQNLLVSLYIKKNEIEKAKLIEAAIGKDFGKMNSLSKYYYLLLKHEIYLAENNAKEAQNTFLKIKKILQIIDTKNKTELNKSNLIVSKYLIYESNKSLAIEQKKKLNTQKELELQKSEFYFMLVIFICIIGLFLVGLFVLYHNLKNRKKKVQLAKEFLLLEDDKLKLKINQQEKTLTEFAINFSQRKEYANEIINQLSVFTSIKESEIKDQLKLFLNQLKIKNNIDKEVEDLNEKSKLIFIQFKNKLKENHPDLNQSEIQLCSLIKLNLSNKEIANFKNITEGSVKTIKYRLKKKLNLSEEQVLSDYLEKIN